ncbi:MAG: DNA polymerase, partial [Nitrososphaera sp.]|nr:DNA polymerase [Nitrososphaera sp.]
LWSAARSVSWSESMESERQASNTPIQGGAADIASRAGVGLQRAYKQYNVPAKIILQVHDEYVTEAPESYTEKSACIMKEVMESCYRLTVPLQADIKSGKSWADCK